MHSRILDTRSFWTNHFAHAESSLQAAAVWLHTKLLEEWRWLENLSPPASLRTHLHFFLERHFVPSQKAVLYRIPSNSHCAANFSNTNHWADFCMNAANPYFTPPPLPSIKLTDTHPLLAPHKEFGGFLIGSQKPLQCGWIEGQTFSFRIVLCCQDNMFLTTNTHLF